MFKKLFGSMAAALLLAGVATMAPALADGKIVVDNSTDQDVVFYVTCGGEEKQYTLDKDHQWEFSDCDSPKIWIGTEGQKGDKEYDLESGHTYTVVLENGSFDIQDKT